MISNPTSPTPLPRLEYTITSRNPDLREHTIIAETAHRALHAKQDEGTYPEYPEIPRLVVLSREEAGEMGVPGFKVKVGGKVGEGSDLRVEGVGAEDEDRVELELEPEIEIGKELAILQVEQEDDVTRSRSRSRSPETNVKPRYEGWEVKVKVKTRRRRRRWWWDSTWVDGWAGKSTASSSLSSSSGGGTESARETVEDNGGMQWEEEGVTVLPGTTVRITTASLMILVPDPQRRRNGQKERADRKCLNAVVVVVVAALLCGRSADHRMGELDAPLLVSTRPTFLAFDPPPGFELSIVPFKRGLISQPFRRGADVRRMESVCQGRTRTARWDLERVVRQ
jgi:hypothetical protein